VLRLRPCPVRCRGKAAGPDPLLRDLVAFLNTLTDKSFLANPAFSDPRAEVKAARNSTTGLSIKKPNSIDARR